MKVFFSRKNCIARKPEEVSWLLWIFVEKLKFCRSQIINLFFKKKTEYHHNIGSTFHTAPTRVEKKREKKANFFQGMSNRVIAVCLTS